MGLGLLNLQQNNTFGFKIPAMDTGFEQGPLCKAFFYVSRLRVFDNLFRNQKNIVSIAVDEVRLSEQTIALLLEKRQLYPTR